MTGKQLKTLYRLIAAALFTAAVWAVGSLSSLPGWLILLLWLVPVVLLSFWASR